VRNTLKGGAGVNAEFIAALNQLEKEKGIEKEVLIEAIESALISAYKKHFDEENVKVTVSRDSGEASVYSLRTVVKEVEDGTHEISPEEASKINPAFELGDIVEVEVTPKTFGRIAAQTAKQVVVQRIREAERGVIYDEYANREGDIVNGVVRRREGRDIMLDLGRAEAVLRGSEQVHSENYKQGDRLKAYIVEVNKTTKGPEIIVSRTHPGLLRRLFELEVPEIHDGIVEIKALAREAGSRAKVAVFSNDDKVDPVGACVGTKGVRVQTIVRELRGEKIDVVRWSEDEAEFVGYALSPAKVVRVDLNEEHHVATVIVPDYQLSLAIGKEGQNARLAAKLTTWKIDIKSETEIAETAARREAEKLFAVDEDTEDETIEESPHGEESPHDDGGLEGPDDDPIEDESQGLAVGKEDIETDLASDETDQGTEEDDRVEDGEGDL